MDDVLKQLCRIPQSERVLLIPHCLRRSETCRAKSNHKGLQCEQCNPECSVNLLSHAARENGYKAICIAPGGKLAIEFVKEKKPQAIIAIACDKELTEGIQGVKELEQLENAPLMIVIPLTKDGCVDTEVNIEEAREIINTGCVEMVPD